MDYLFLLAGFGILLFGGELLVRGAAGIALKSNIPPLVVGLTVVSMGTSAPELFTSLQAAWNGNPGIAVGNVVGSNIANLGLVLGITTLIFPIAVDRSILRTDWPMMIIATLAFFIFGIDGRISWLDGIILFSALVFFTTYLILRSKWNNDAPTGEKVATVDGEIVELSKFSSKGYLMLSVLVLLGGIGLYFGSELFLKGAVGVAKQFGLSDHVIGVTVIAFGTSVPELAASGIAAFRKQTDISIGNLIGSNIFNILCVLGITSMVSPLAVESSVLENDFYWMLAIALVLFPMIYFKNKVGRIDGGILLASYVVYVVLLLV